MILLIDIGNTCIVLGAAKNKGIMKVDRIDTETGSNVLYLEKAVKGYFKKNKIIKKQIEAVVFCSVVPSLSSSFKRALKRLLSCAVFELGKDLKYKIKNRYKTPGQVGADRLVNAIAAHHLYGEKNIVIIDFGTAITFDAVNKKGDYLGGVIVPGIKSSLKALSADAELLPEISLMKARGLIGRDTVTSMSNGIIYATAAACEGIVARYKRKFGKGFIVLATGGYAGLIKQHTSCIDKVEPNLTLRGLLISYSENGRKTG
ncbi:MAG: type III pantothenate kinase [Candidatus Omnitrophica bacterium]|nr:type III pantothenate kinase [Candidatus Omnitrophota bacterium]